MSAQVISLKTRQIISGGSEIEAPEDATATQAIDDLDFLIEQALQARPSRRIARMLNEASRVIDSLSDAIAAIETPA